MKIQHYFSLLYFLLAGFYVSGQSIPVSSIEPSVHSTISPQELQTQLDEASASSRIYFHARQYEVNNELSTVTPDMDGYYYKISGENLAIRVFLHIEGFYTGDTLFLMNESGQRREYVCSANLYDSNWSSALYNNEVTLFYKNASGQAPLVKILSYSLEINKTTTGTEDFGMADFCEVNANCSEGDAYDDVKKGVARILIKNGQNFSWCTGTLVNNTSRDCRLLMMTAEHCGLQGSNFANPADVGKWEFYFNYETPGCADISSEGRDSK